MNNFRPFSSQLSLRALVEDILKRGIVGKFSEINEKR